MFYLLMRDFVRVMPGNEKQFIETATALGYDELVLVYSYKNAKSLDKNHKKTLQNTTKIRLFTATLVDRDGLRLEGIDFHIGLGTKIRVVSQGLDFLHFNEYDERKDGLHQRRGGINHVTLADCREKDVKLLFGFTDLYKEKRVETVLGRAMQNAKLCAKKEVEFIVCSMAKNAINMKAPRDVLAFSNELC